MKVGIMKHMPYTTNPSMPKVRMNAVKLVRLGWSMRKVARHTGYNPSTISRWARTAPKDSRFNIETKSSRPRSHPMTTDDDTRQKIIAERLKNGRCGNVIHQVLLKQGVKISLSTVNRVLDKHGLFKKKSKWKRWHIKTARPLPEKPGDLVQIDTIHIMKNDYTRCYIYTLIDVHSRWAYAMASDKLGAGKSLEFVLKARESAPFRFNCIQSDNGAEYSTFFSQNVGIRHRHTRVRRPTDNAHIERFNRTIQTECVRYYSESIDAMNEKIESYLSYYNNERLHMGINFLTPSEKLALVLQSY
jgi:transposase InsO family protein